jgi:uncharacterized RDD family membrane protein YckC
MAAPEPLPPGTRLAHYEVRGVLGAGGMGTVYLAHDTALDRPVALKVLRPEIADDPGLVDRFTRESRAAARVSHPNLTHVHFVGADGGRPFFAMEYCPGATLEAAVKSGGPFPLERGLDALAQAARGLAAAHGAGVVHRDVKPSNLMVLPDGTVKVTDFGLAKSLRGDVEASGGRIQGTPTYMSPEQVRGKPVDARTDVYLLGLTAWWLFTGRPPFEAENVGAMIDAQLNRPLPPLSSARPGLPPALGALLARMCAKEPAARPGTMEEVVRALEALRPRPLYPGPILGRGVATAIDGVLVLMAWGGAGFVLVQGLALAGIDIQHRFEDPDGAVVFGPPAGVSRALFLLTLLLLAAGMEKRFGTTAGKVSLHLGVVRADGTPAGWGALLLRFAAKYPSAILLALPVGGANWAILLLGLQAFAFSLGALWYFLASGRTVGDVLSGTRVVVRTPAAGGRVP